MNKPLRLGLFEPVAGHGAIGVGIRRARLLALLAFRAGRLANRTAYRQWLAEQLLLPGRRAAEAAKLLVLHIVQAQGIAMAQHDAALAPDQYSGVGQPGHARGLQERITGQEVAVAHHEKQGALRACCT